ncbi:MAG: putative membrane protein [Candidatus Azotimanducaceae bacterium]|jgi:uncharacterized membrane protein
MIRSEINPETQTGQIVLRPNFSMTWRGNLYFLCGLSCLSLVIGLGFLVNGAWLVLPYSILEMLILAICLYSCVRKCYQQEIITLFTDEVIVEKGRFSAQERWAYPRFWSKFLVKTSKHPWQPKQVTLRSHGNEIELGSFLNEKDKTLLIEELKNVVVFKTDKSAATLS